MCHLLVLFVCDGILIYKKKKIFSFLIGRSFGHSSPTLFLFLFYLILIFYFFLIQKIRRKVNKLKVNNDYDVNNNDIIKAERGKVTL